MQLKVPSVSPTAVYDMMSSGEPVRLIDVRTLAEYHDGHADGAESAPLDQICAERLAAPSTRGREATLYLICASGNRAQRAAERLLREGISNVALVEGGTEAWNKRRLPMQRRTRALSFERYLKSHSGAFAAKRL